jgi:YbbR domain-containing protein
VEGEPAAGYVVGAVTSDPPSVEVSGPASLVKEATEALTETVSIAGATDHVVENVAVGLDYPSLRLKSPRTATVRIEILPAPRERVLRIRPVHLRGVGADLTARSIPPAVDVIVRGTGEGLNRLDPADVVAFVDLGSLGVGEYTLPVKIDDFSGAGVVRIVPASVQVRITSARD